MERKNGIIVLVEDETVLQDSLARQLTKADYQIISFLDGEEAWEFLKHNGSKIDLIILDLLLPGMSGQDIARKLLKRYDIADKILVLTNIHEMTEVDYFLKLGVTNYLLKAEQELADIVTKAKELIDQ